MVRNKITYIFSAGAVFTATLFAPSTSHATSPECAPREIQRLALNAGELKKILERGMCDLWHSDSSISNQKRALSENWTLEYVGADLVKEDFLRGQKVPHGLVGVGDSDTAAFHHHGRRVLEVIAGGSVYSALPGAEQVQNYEMLGTDPSIKSTFQNPDLLGKPGHTPRYLNLSMRWKKNDIGEDLVAMSLRPGLKNSRFIVAAGNEASLVEKDLAESVASDPRIFVVSSLAPTGTPFTSSSFGPLAVSAPSDNLQIVEDEEGKQHRFGQTSGATPIVTAGLAAFDMISGYSPSPAELRTLLKNTVIPHLFDNPKEEYGAGMINSYRLAAVAKRLKTQCGGNASCIKKAIAQPETYQFPKDKNVADEIAKHFPDCQPEGKKGGNSSGELDCSAGAEAMKKIRRAAFLNPQDKQLWQALACIHGQHGLHVNAIYYAKLGGSKEQVAKFKLSYLKESEPDKKDLAERKSDLLEDAVFSQGSLDDIKGYTSTGEPFLRRLNKILERDPVASAKHLSSMEARERDSLMGNLSYNQKLNDEIKAAGEPKWLKLLRQNPDETIGAEATDLLYSWSGPDDRMKLARDSLKDKRAAVRREGARFVARLLSGTTSDRMSQAERDKIFALFEETLKNPDSELAAKAVGGLNGLDPRHKKWLEKLVNHPNPKVREAAKSR